MQEHNVPVDILVVLYASNHHAKFHKALQHTCFVINAHDKLTTKTNWSRSWKYLILVDKESQRICKIYKRYSYTYACPVIMNL